jgi:small subunit ribosomal protein S7
MSRRHSAEKREVMPDAKFGDLVLTKFINSLMYAGKKSVAEHIVYDAFDQIQKKSGQDPLRVFHDALENVRPQLRAQALAIRWLIGMARGRSESTMVDRLSAELLDAGNNRGAAVKKREDTHRMAEANKAFSHYRW